MVMHESVQPVPMMQAYAVIDCYYLTMLRCLYVVCKKHPVHLKQCQHVMEFGMKLFDFDDLSGL